METSLNLRTNFSRKRATRRGIPGGKLPDFDFQLQIDSELFGDPGAGKIDKAEDVLSGRPLVRNDEIGVSFADFSVSDAGSLESGFVNQESGTHPSGVFEDAAC